MPWDRSFSDTKEEERPCRNHNPSYYPVSVVFVNLNIKRGSLEPAHSPHVHQSLQNYGLRPMLYSTLLYWIYSNQVGKKCLPKDKILTGHCLKWQYHAI